MPAISFTNAVKSKQENIPEEVLFIVNNLIISALNSSLVAVLTQDEIVEDISNKMNLPRHEVFERHYLDFEQLYRNAGWDVDYDKPAYNETYKASFTFSKKKDL